MTSDADQAALALARGFERAAAVHPGLASGHEFRIGGRHLRLRVIGIDLAPRVTWAIDHLRRPASGAPELAIGLWDGAATGSRRPLGDLRRSFPTATPFNEGVVATARRGRLLAHQSPHATMILDLDAATAHGWISTAAAILPYALQPILCGWQAAHDLLPVHAGLIARGGHGVLLAGRQDSGKSTTALLCAAAGFAYLGDDFVGLAPPGPDGMAGHSLYAVARLEAEHSRRLPWLAAQGPGAADGSDKRVFSMLDAAAVRLAERATIRAVLLPRLVPGTTAASLRPAAPGQALLRAAPSSVLQLPFVPAPRVLARLAQLMRSVPCYWLDLGRDLDSVPERIGRLLDGLAGG